MKKRIFSLFIVLVYLSTLPVQAFSTDEFDPNLSHNTSYLDNFNVYYEMDGENVIERVLLSNIEIVRTIYPDNTMLIESVEDGVGVRVVIDADYSVFKSLYTAQQSPAFCNNEIVGSQYIHQFVGSPGTVVITKESLRNARDEAWVVSLLLSKFSYPASVAFGVAAVLYGREYENADYYEVHVTSDTYQVLFAIDHSYYIHCYHQRFEYYKENATRPYKTETDYYQAIGG